MKIVVKVGYIITSIIFLSYLLVPNLKFPKKPTDSLQSNEPADTESVYRKAYFTNFDREEVVGHYIRQMKKVFLFGINLPTYRLNYPPEEAQTIIRDQTRSTFLEEIVHPFRESMFVNGFEPKDPKDAVIIQDKLWRQKIIIRKVESDVWMRFLLGLVSVIIIPIIWKNFMLSLEEFRKEISKLWTFR
jgi:hypothetical protein